MLQLAKYIECKKAMADVGVLKAAWALEEVIKDES